MVVLFFKSTTTNQSDICGGQAHGYSDNVLKIFMNMSNITQNEASDISSTAKEIKFCKDEIPELALHPGQQFTIPLIALGQANSPVPATVYWETMDKDSEYRLSPSGSTITDSCTNVSFWLYTSNLLELHYFKLYPKNSCQKQDERLILSIEVLPCPVGFNLSWSSSKCICAMELKKFRIQNCYIDSKSGTVE